MKMSRIILPLLCAAGLSIVAVMRGNEPKHVQKHISPINKEIVDRWNNHAVDSVLTTLRSGDVVLRMGLGADSYLLSLINRRDKSYSHCGIVMIEDGKPLVYHCVGGEDNPDERMRSDDAKLFFTPAHNTAIALVHYEFDCHTIEKLHNVVHAYYSKRPKFDLKFDLATDDELYCSEFVSKAINNATHDTAHIPVSHVRGKTFIGIDDLFMNKHAQMQWQIKFKQYLCDTSKRDS
jgi:hypothetical protein